MPGAKVTHSATATATVTSTLSSFNITGNNNNWTGGINRTSETGGITVAMNSGHALTLRGWPYTVAWPTPSTAARCS